MMRRWVQKIGRKTRRKETAASRAMIAQGTAAANEGLRTYLRTGECGCGRRDRNPSVDPATGRNAHGHVMAAARPRPKPWITGARDRRREAWSLRANNVTRDKRTGRFKSR